LIALHDIVSTHPYCPGTRRFWNEIKGQFENRLRRGGQAHFAPKAPQNEPVPGGSYHEFVEQYPGRQNVMGIGLIETELAEFAPEYQQPRHDDSRTMAQAGDHAAAIDEILGSGGFQR
jgi:hypothetical protein